MRALSWPFLLLTGPRSLGGGQCSRGAETLLADLSALMRCSSLATTGAQSESAREEGQLEGGGE